MTKTQEKDSLVAGIHSVQALLSNTPGKVNHLVLLKSSSNKKLHELQKLAEKNKILPLEKAVYKITGLPAKFMKLKGRGIIREGYLADLVVFKNSQIREVILNGQRVVKDGEYKNELAGKIVKRSNL